MIRNVPAAASAAAEIPKALIFIHLSCKWRSGTMHVGCRERNNSTVAVPTPFMGGS
jgi:hypothetical protein